ncbi:MAG: hypothetical protein ABI672_04270 [Vicinamibacteria bacterium]
MKVTVELSESELKEVCRVTGQPKKGPAIRMLVVNTLLLKRREQLAEKFISGEWGVALDGVEAGMAAEAKTEFSRAKKWRA